MNKFKKNISVFQAICLIVIIAINRITLYLPQVIINSCGSSAILNIIFISLIVLLFVIFLSKLYKNFPNSDIIDISLFLGGKFLKTFISIVLIIYLFSISSTVLRSFAEVIHIIYYLPISLILLSFLIVSIILNFLGDNSIIRSNVFFTIILFVGLIIIFIFSIPNIEVNRVFPILGEGFSETFLKGISNISAFNGLITIYFIMPFLEEKEKFKKSIIISTIIVEILLLLSVGSLLLTMPYSFNLDNISSIFIVISRSGFGNFIKHPESLFVFTWILSLMSYVNIITMFIIKYFKKLFCLNNSKAFIIPVCLFIVLFAIIPKNIYSTFIFEELIYKYISIPIIFIIFPIILIFSNVKFKRKNKFKNKEI